MMAVRISKGLDMLTRAPERRFTSAGSTENTMWEYPKPRARARLLLRWLLIVTEATILQLDELVSGLPNVRRWFSNAASMNPPNGAVTLPQRASFTSTGP